MIKVMIVDDELLVRTNLKYLIDWKLHQYEICAEAKNGKEALELIGKVDPDIVITDVRMPLLDGIGLVQAVNSRFPHVKMIVLSNYDDFEYVRSAMKHGVADYMLKHNLNEKTLLESLESAKKLLSAKRHPIHSLAPNNLLTLRNKFLNGLLAGLYNADEIKHHVRILDIKLQSSNYCAIVLTVDGYKQRTSEGNYRDLSLLHFGIVNIIEEVLNDYGDGAVCHVANEQFVLILTFKSIVSLSAVDNTVHALLERISLCLKRFLNLSVTFSLGEICLQLQEVKKSYESAAALLAQKFLFGKNAVLKQTKNGGLTHSFAGIGMDRERSLLDDIHGRRYDGAVKQVDGLFDSIVRDKLNLYSSQVIFNDLVTIVNRICKEKYIELGKLYRMKSHFDIIMSFESIEDARQWFVQLFRSLFHELEQAGANYPSPHVNNAIRYIRNHYAKDLSLDHIADEVNISSVYLSKLFKEQVGTGVSEYLNEIRLNKAVSLMEDGSYELKDIIRACGYLNYPYFFRVFKKKYGVTPTQYLERRRINS